MNNLVYQRASSSEEIAQIIALQQQNLGTEVGAEEQRSQGFVTVKHTQALLEEMNRKAPAIIAKAGEELAGYALIMPQSFRGTVPVLDPMFEKMDALSWKGKPLNDYRFFVMGQICVAKPWRGQGVFDALYAHMKEATKHEYDLVVTEVASRNLRSLKAHLRVGFQILLTYPAPDGEMWELVVWELV